MEVMFSVVIPLYNKEKYILKTLESVLLQTYGNFEIIVIDDGSSDKSFELVKSVKDPRVRVYKQKNSGVSSSRNRGIRLAKGKYIAFLDADDEWSHDKLELHKNLHDNNDLLWSCSGYSIATKSAGRDVVFSNDNILYDPLSSICRGLTIWTSTVVINSTIFDDDNYLFNESMHLSEDRELWYKLACSQRELGYINKVIAKYNYDDTSLTKSSLNEKHLSFLSMKRRLAKDLSYLDTEKKVEFFNFIDRFNRKAILNLYCHTIFFKTYYKEIHFYYPLLASVLKNTLWLPILVKKSAFRIFSFFYR